MSKLIPLTQGHHAIVDDDDYDFLMQWKWFSGKRGYVLRKAPGHNTQTLCMHRVVMGLEPSDPRRVDHINRNTADNRRCNLRLVTIRLNSLNRVGTKTARSYSHYKGVTFHKRQNKWQAQLFVDGKQLYLGKFESEHEAAVAYNAAAQKHFGEYAFLNTVGEL